MPTLLEGCLIKNDSDRALIAFMEEKFLPFALSLEKAGYSINEIAEGVIICVNTWKDRNSHNV